MRIAVVGAGVGGLAAAVRLAAQGHRVRVFEAGPAPGGKCGRVERDGFAWDSGPSLLTMPWVFEELFAQTGAPLAEELELLPVEPVTRYAFADGTAVELSADVERSRAALDAWAPGTGAEWARFLRTCAGMWRAAEPVLRGPAPWPPPVRATLGRTARASGTASRPSPAALLRIQPWRTLRDLARAHTSDPRLQLVIERFATYAGADPRRAPAVLALAGYPEHAWGAWHPGGGMYALVAALVRRLEELGGDVLLSTPVRRILRDARRRAVAGVETDAGAEPADAVVAAIDADTVAGTLLGRPVRRREHSVSGLAVMLGLRGSTPGLVHHAIRFPADYDAEFDDVFVLRRPARDATLYVSATCATDPAEAPAGGENWFVLVNAPAIGAGADWAAEAERVIDRLGVRPRVVTSAVRSPADLERESGGVAGSIYGVAPHGRLGTLRRPGTRMRGVPGLWLAGGTVHPGGGLPLVALGAAAVAAEIGPAAG